MAYTPIKTIAEYLSAIYDAVQNVRTLGAVRGVANDFRVTVLSAPSTAVTGTVAVSTVTTVTNQSQVGGLLANQVVPAQQNTVAVLSNINNVIIS